MKVFVKISCYSASANKRLERLLNSNKVVTGAFVPDKGAFMVMDIKSAGELFDVVGPSLGTCSIEAKILSREKVIA